MRTIKLPAPLAAPRAIPRHTPHIYADPSTPYAPYLTSDDDPYEPIEPTIDYYDILSEYSLRAAGILTD